MNAGPSAAPQAPPGGRVFSIDLLRGWAVIVMIETHLVNATITPEIAGSPPFQWLKFLNGLVAPSFLFASGMAYALTTRRKIAHYLGFEKPLFRQFGRLLLILAVGYGLHIPVFSYARLREGVSDRAWLAFLQVDVLHCIAVSLLLLQVLLLLLRTERRMYAAVTILAAGMLVATPLLWAQDLTVHMPAAVAAYLNGLHVSLFPLFPWSVFLFCGALSGYLFARAQETAGGEERFLRRLPVAGGALILLGLLAAPLAGAVYATYDFWRYGPPFVLIRIGIVLLLLAGAFLYERRFGIAPGSPVTLLGRESLLVYSLHLLLIYGDFGSYNFRKAINHTYGYLDTLPAIVALLLLMYAAAFWWEKIKRQAPRLKATVLAAVLTGLLLVFFFGPGK